MSWRRLAFLSEAITEDPQRRRGRSVLAVFCKIIVSPLDPFKFYCSLLFLCLFCSAVSVLTVAQLSSILFSVQLSVPSRFLILLSSHLRSRAALFRFIR